jgi:uncharacterized protein YceK
MAFRTICVALLLSSLPIAGCGTVANLAKPGPEGGKSPFGGVKQDVDCIQTGKTGEGGLNTHSSPESEKQPPAARVIFSAADLPFSFIGDVLTWPYTAAYTFINEPIPTPPVSQGPNEGLPRLFPPVSQAPTEGGPQWVETLPQPSKRP